MLVVTRRTRIVTSPRFRIPNRARSVQATRKGAPSDRALGRVRRGPDLREKAKDGPRLLRIQVMESPRELPNLPNLLLPLLDRSGDSYSLSKNENRSIVHLRQLRELSLPPLALPARRLPLPLLTKLRLVRAPFMFGRDTWLFTERIPT